MAGVSSSFFRYRRNTLFCRAVTSILSQRLLHKGANSSPVLPPDTSDKLIQCICRNVNCAQGKQCLHSRRNFISTFTEFAWPWRRTMTNGSDVKYVFPLTNGNDVKRVFPQYTSNMFSSNFSRNKLRCIDHVA